jgi:hypothetical protein
VKRIFAAAGLTQKPIHNVRWRNVTAQGEDAGSIAFARDWRMAGVHLDVPAGRELKVTDSERVDSTSGPKPRATSFRFQCGGPVAGGAVALSPRAVYTREQAFGGGHPDTGCRYRCGE